MMKHIKWKVNIKMAGILAGVLLLFSSLYDVVTGRNEK